MTTSSSNGQHDYRKADWLLSVESDFVTATLDGNSFAVARATGDKTGGRPEQERISNLALMAASHSMFRALEQISDKTSVNWLDIARSLASRAIDHLLVLFESHPPAPGPWSLTFESALGAPKITAAVDGTPFEIASLLEPGGGPSAREVGSLIQAAPSLFEALKTILDQKAGLSIEEARAIARPLYRA